MVLHDEGLEMDNDEEESGSNNDGLFNLIAARKLDEAATRLHSLSKKQAAREVLHDLFYARSSLEGDIQELKLKQSEKRRKVSENSRRSRCS